MHISQISISFVISFGEIKLSEISILRLIGINKIFCLCEQFCKYFELLLLFALTFNNKIRVLLIILDLF